MASAWNDTVGSFNSMSIRLHDPAVSLNTVTGLMASLVYTVQFTRDRFDCMNRCRPKILKMVNTRTSSVESVCESECVSKEQQTKQTSAHGQEVSDHDRNLVG
jgi:hypothetical protein